ncbi:hypothetical protein QJS66_22670 [Kocuria rhizophila]|nr:hypothetical protein QJS66_22670 [Kocuria rhizophila]
MPDNRCRRAGSSPVNTSTPAMVATAGTWAPALVRHRTASAMVAPW